MPTQNYIELKRKALEKYFGFLNPQQRKAVFNINGPQLILAGAGSGKTSVIINRIINLTMFGNAYYDEIVQGSANDIKCIQQFLDGSCEDSDLLRQATAVATVKPWNIVAITFTNKSAKELKDRLFSALGEQAYMINASTFHALCLKILRQHINLLGYDNNFTIYDTKDSQKLIKNCILELDILEKNFPPKSVSAIISSAKGKLMSPMDTLNSISENDYRLKNIAKIYALYQQKLMDSNALDFDDIIKLTVDLFDNFPDVLSKYQNKFKYIMVDEYQDTNYAQFHLVRLLSQAHNNICVVGDDDQSIYAFRGANIDNILDFEKYFPNTTVIKLEQNYRSTQNILNASNNLISHNTNRTDKKLWTSVGGGECVSVYKATDETDEADFVSSVIQQLVISGECSYKDCAILYRVNALSNALEKSMVRNSIPYRVYGGTKFYERKEIQDVIAYLNVINNENDMLRLKRIINEPKRGIGDATLEVIEEISADLKVSPLKVMRNAGEYSLLTKKATTLKNVSKMFDILIEKSQTMMLDEFIDFLLDITKYNEYLATLGDEGLDRKANIMELKSNVVQYIKESDNPTLGGFLEQISLFNDTDKLNDDNCVSLMTIHNSKGLEFSNVFIVGMEESIFPSDKNSSDIEELEEERRVAYVGMTRAKKQLMVSSATQRTLYGLTKNNYQSRFINEMGSNLNYKKSNTKNTYSTKKTPAAYQSFTLQQQIAKKKAQEKVASTPQNVLFAEGDTVFHSIFGTGTVTQVTHTGGDCMLRVDFARVGTKTIMTNYTKVKKIN